MEYKRISKLRKIVTKFTPVDDISKDTREIEYVHARSIFYKVIRDNSKLSLNEIGELLNLAHCTVLHSLKNFDGYYKDFKSFRDSYDRVVYETKYLFEEVPTSYNEEFVELKIKYNALNDKFKILKRDYQDNITNNHHSLTIKDVLKGLNDDQVNSLIEDRIKPYVRLCKDQNRRNGYYIDKRATA